MSTEISPYLLSPQRTLATVRAHRHRILSSKLVYYSLKHEGAIIRDILATRAWFAGKKAGWSPAERVRRAAANAGEIWAE